VGEFAALLGVDELLALGEVVVGCVAQLDRAGGDGEHLDTAALGLIGSDVAHPLVDRRLAGTVGGQPG
jgi:hypothetical protein